MKKSLLSIVTAMLFVVNLFGQSNDEYAITLNEMFELSGTEQTYKVAIDQMFSMFKGRYPDIEENRWQELQKEFQGEAFVSLTELLLPVYRKHLSLEDLKGAVAFYKTPAGANLAKSTPLITQESMQIGQQWGMKIGEEFAKKMEERGY